MSWTEPPTFASDTVLTAADTNILSEDLRYLKGIADGTTFTGVQLHRTSAQSIPTATDEDIVWQAEDFDIGSWWSTGATITVPASAVPDGYTTIACLVNAAIRFVPDGSSGRQLAILVNGSEVKIYGIRSVESDYVTVGFSWIIIVAAGDDIRLQARQSSGANLDMDAADVQIVRLAPVA